MVRWYGELGVNEAGLIKLGCWVVGPAGIEVWLADRNRELGLVPYKLDKELAPKEPGLQNIGLVP